MAQGGQETDEDIISRQMSKLHLMDESDNYVPDVQAQPPVHTGGQMVQPSGAVPVHAGLPSGIPPSAHPPQVLAGGHGPDVSVIYSQNPQLSGQPGNPDMTGKNPAAAPIQPGEPVLKFFGGYPTSPAGSGAARQIGHGPPAGSIASTSTAVDPQQNIASKISFRSLKSGPRDLIPDYAFRSDPCNMSSFVDAQYVPVPQAENEFLAFMPNVFDPRKPIPMNMTHEEIVLIYDALNHHRQRQAQAQQKERDLYDGSVNPIPHDDLNPS